MAVADRIRAGAAPARVRFRGTQAAWPVAAAGVVCVGIGAAAGVSPKYALLAAVGLLFAVAAITDLTLALVLFTVASFLDVLSASGSFSATKLIGLLVFVSWLARATTRRAVGAPSFVAENPLLTASLVGLVCWTGLSATWAQSRGTALTGTLTLVLDVLLVPIAFTAIGKRQHGVAVIVAFVVGALLSGTYGLLSSTATSGMDAGRLTGTLGESNAEGTVLAAAIPLLVALAPAARNSARLKLAVLVGVVLLFASLIQTLSREGLLSLAAVMVAAVVFGGRWRRRAAVLLVIGVAATVGYYFVLAPAASRQRVTMSDTSGRSSLWTVAGRVIRAHPGLGVGNNNFPLVERQYINQAGAIQAYYVVKTPKYAHNTFLEEAADLGIPGLVLLVAVYALLLASAIRAARIFERLDDRPMELLSRGVFLAMVALMTTDFFVSGNSAKYQWLLLALGPALLGLARRAAAGRPERARAALPEY